MRRYLVQELLRALVKEYYPLQVYSTLQSGREHKSYFRPYEALMLVLFGVKNTLHVVENLFLALGVKQG